MLAKEVVGLRDRISRLIELVPAIDFWRPVRRFGRREFGGLAERVEADGQARPTIAAA